MPTLNWIGKEAVVEHHRHVPTRLLECDRELSAGDPEAENLLVEGDNLEALKALLPRYRGQVKCIYIDPPYNTGNENWVYNDNVNDPRIRKWLGDVVGKEAEDLCRHDKWLCMMYPRLALLQQMLCDDGVFLCSIDENEYHVLKLVLDEVFGRSSYLGTISWKTRNTDNRVKTRLSVDHEHVLVYSRDGSLQGRVIDRSDFANPDDDQRGSYVTDPLTGKATASERRNLHYDIVNPKTGDVYPPDPARGWITDKAGYDVLLNDNRIAWPQNPKTGKPRKKRFLSETSKRMPVSSFWADIKGQTGADELDRIVGERRFAFPKAVDFISRLLDVACDENAIVLDSFAGSGTTAHAVLSLNRLSGANRRFITIEMDSEICRTLTQLRLRRAIEGYEAAETGGGGQAGYVAGLGSGFRYCRLGRTLLDADGNINGDVPFTDLARYVYLLATGVPAPKQPRKDCPLLGVHHGQAIYLLYNGVLGDRRPAGGNVLTGPVLAHLPPHPAGRGPRVVYGEACRLSEATLRREEITFRQIPYSLRD